uniref:Uncharacterized protein n=1 Tax=Anguilla anguilla TaxID=7936 RepID=A0A0E9WER5_ANGAN
MIFFSFVAIYDQTFEMTDLMLRLHRPRTYRGMRTSSLTQIEIIFYIKQSKLNKYNTHTKKTC